MDADASDGTATSAAPIPRQNGALLARIRTVARRALADGVVVPASTRRHWLEERGVRFLVHELRGRDEKQRSTESQRRSGRCPFCPPEPGVVVGELGFDYDVVLNKFPVLADHAVLITRAHLRQDAPLARADLAVALLALELGDGVVFYNSGPAAGASQPHRHLQWVPSPLGAGPERMPFERLLPASAAPGVPVRAAALPCRHAFGRHALGVDDVEAALELHTRLRHACGAPDAPFNLIVTRTWLGLVPRSGHQTVGIPVNALGYAGALLTQSPAATARLRAMGPLSVLARAGIPGPV